MENNGFLEGRSLVLAPYGRDAETIVTVLSRNDSDATLCHSMQELLDEIVRGAGTALITEEALRAENITPLAQWLSTQPSWSDFPIILLISSQSKRNALPVDMLADLSNVILLERPLNAETLRRAAASALRARKRQYQARRVLYECTLAEERLRLALNAGRLGAWEIELASSKLSASDTCKANFGRNADAVFTYADLQAAIHADDAKRFRLVVQKAIAAAADFDIEFRVVWPDGSLHWVQMRGETELGKQGAPIGLAGVSLDVTERLESAEKLRVSQAALQHMNDTLESRIHERTSELAQLNNRLMREINERERTQAALVQAQKMEAIGRLTGGIAHDFNNLLHVVVGNVDLIDLISTDERVKRFAATVKKATQRGTKLTGQLLAFARNQSLDLKAVDVCALIEGMQDLIRISVGSTIQVEFNLQHDKRPALADMNQIEMAILNLAINARDAMPEGGKITISCSVVEIGDDILPAGDYASIRVTDSGTGIAPDILGKVFDPFFTTKAVGQGTGLGLSQVYGIAQQSGGAAKIHSQLGHGTTVEIILPLATEAAIAVASAELAPQSNFHGKKILVVEDDAEVRQFMVDSLKLLGYEVDEAEDGLSGLHKIAQYVPDLLILDFLMEGMNGAEVIKKLNVLNPDLPIIVATGYADMRAIDAVIGKNAILRKPFQIDELAKSVQAALHQGEATALNPI